MRRQIFNGSYVRGGQRTLYMSREDVVETLAMLLRENYDLQAMQAEARILNADLKRAKLDPARLTIFQECPLKFKVPK